MTMQKALNTLRKMGFNTKKESGTWYISKPYYNGNSIFQWSENGEFYVTCYSDSEMRYVYVLFDEFVKAYEEHRPMEIARMLRANNA